MPLLGGARRARRIAKYLGMKIALLENRIENGMRVMNVVGTIEENAVIVDDMIDTGTKRTNMRFAITSTMLTTVQAID